MGKGLLLKGGAGGIDPDELNATTGDVIKGKKFGGSGSDEPLTGTLELTGNAADSQVLKGATYYNTDAKSKRTGTMPDWRGTPQHIDARRISNNRFEVAVAAGYHGYNWAGNSYEYMEYSEVANTLGLTAAKLAQGQSACGLTGTYKGLGNAGTADVRKGKTFSTSSLSNATGTMPEQGGSTTTPGTANKTIVSANRYVTGNIIVAGNGNLVPAYIKKGVNIFGVTGTFEGWVPTPTDLYLNGVNSAGFSSSNSRVTIESGGIRYNNGRTEIRSTQTYNLSKYTKLNIEYQFSSVGQPYVHVGLTDGVNTSPIVWAIFSPGIGTKKTFSMDISSVAMSTKLGLDLYSITTSSGSGTVGTITGWIYHIWLS